MAEKKSMLTKKENFYLSTEEIDYISKVMQVNSYKKSEALRKIIQEHKANSALNQDEFHKKIADRIYENYKEQVASSANCSRITDRNVQVLLEMFNSFLVNNSNEHDTHITTDQFKSPMLILAEKEIENRINRNHKKAKGVLE